MGLAAGQSGHNLFAVESAIFDKDFACLIPANDYAREKDARDIAFVRLRVHRRLIRRPIQ